MTLFKLKDSKYYWVNIVHPITNKRIRKSTKKSNKKEAEMYHAELLSNLLKGNESVLQTSVVKYTFENLKDRWLLEKRHKKSIRDDVSKLNILEKSFKGKCLQELNQKELRAFLDDIAEKRTGATANRYRALILAMLNKAKKEWGWIREVPYLPPYHESSVRIRYLTKQQVDRLLQELPYHLKMMAVFSLQTGLRQGNVKSLRWSQVNFNSKSLVCYPEETKSGKYINIPLNKEALNVLKELKGKHFEYVFSYNGHAPIENVATKAWRNALKRAGIEDFRWHDLRHTWASWHIQNGTPLMVLKELGGWSSLDMVMKYAHLGQSHLHEYADNI